MLAAIFPDSKRFAILRTECFIAPFLMPVQLSRCLLGEEQDHKPLRLKTRVDLEAICTCFYHDMVRPYEDRMSTYGQANMRSE